MTTSASACGICSRPGCLRPRISPRCKRLRRACRKPAGTGGATDTPGIAAAATARELLTRYDDNRDGLLAIEELGLKQEAAADFDQDRNACLDLAETEQMLRRPPTTVTLECRWPQHDTTPRTIALGDQTAVVELFPRRRPLIATWMLQLFTVADRDRNQYLEAAEADGLLPLKRAFRVIDRDADGKIFAADSSTMRSASL